MREQKLIVSVYRYFCVEVCKTSKMPLQQTNLKLKLRNASRWDTLQQIKQLQQKGLHWLQ